MRSENLTNERQVGGAVTLARYGRAHFRRITKGRKPRRRLAANAVVTRPELEAVAAIFAEVATV